MNQNLENWFQPKSNFFLLLLLSKHPERRTVFSVISAMDSRGR